MIKESKKEKAEALAKKALEASQRFRNWIESESGGSFFRWLKNGKEIQKNNK